MMEKQKQISKKNISDSSVIAAKNKHQRTCQARDKDQHDDEEEGWDEEVFMIEEEMVDYATGNILWKLVDIGFKISLTFDKRPSPHLRQCMKCGIWGHFLGKNRLTLHENVPLAWFDLIHD